MNYRNEQRARRSRRRTRRVIDARRAFALALASSFVSTFGPVKKKERIETWRWYDGGTYKILPGTGLTSGNGGNISIVGGSGTRFP